MKNKMYLLVIFIILIIFASCSKPEKKSNDEVYYGNSNTQATTEAKTVRYEIEGNKVTTDDYSFDLPEGYEIKGNENYISAESVASDINISVDSLTDDATTLEEYIDKRINAIAITGYEVSEPKEVEINGVTYTELRIGKPGRSETEPIGCEYICSGKSGIITVTTSGNGFTAIDTTESEELVKQFNLDIY